MNVGRIGVLSQNCQKPLCFKADEKSAKYENPVSRNTEKNLAILKTAAVSTVVGAIAGGLVSSFGFKNKRIPWIIGGAVGAFTAMVTGPANIYNTKVSAYAKQKEMDVFSRDRSLKTNLTEEVDKEVQDKNVSLDKKLDDNLKLQMANRGNALGIANITSQG